MGVHGTARPTLRGLFLEFISGDPRYPRLKFMSLVVGVHG